MSLIGCANKETGLSKVFFTGTYINDIDKDLALTLYGHTTIQYVEKYTIPANDKLEINSDGNIEPFIYLDSLHCVWAGEREFWFRGEETLVFKYNWAYNRQYENDWYFRYYYNFTREMYDTATPIDQPAEE